MAADHIVSGGRMARKKHGRVRAPLIVGLAAWACLLTCAAVATSRYYGVDWTRILEYRALLRRFGLFALLSLVVVLGLVGFVVTHRRRSVRRRIRALASGRVEMTPEAFLAARRASFGSVGEKEFAGVYVLHNSTRDKYYVGQGQRVLSRVTQHFSGHGNGDVYADWSYGDAFTIRTIALRGSGYRSLDDLERDTITAFSAYDDGYNRTRGNGA